ncbi:MAG: glutathione peroxidase [Bdellovibrionales bacterium]|nr:glutathione peroxidase [Bdellovibrionales bacterium]
MRYLFWFFAIVLSLELHAGSGIHGFVVEDIDGKPQLLSQYQGKVLLIVNTASQCGFTYQYSGLEELYQKYQKQGFEVLAFPSNDFLGQEPGDNSSIKLFVQNKKNVTFPMFSKIRVKPGKTQDPLYQYLTQSPDHTFGGKVSWNFNKFLISREGGVIGRFSTRTEPMDPELLESVERALQRPQDKQVQ